MTNGSNGTWQKIAILLLTALGTITLTWTASQSKDDEKQDDKIAALEENVRNIHHEQSVDRDILNRIDRNTGGDGNAPPVRPLREVDD